MSRKRTKPTPEQLEDVKKYYSEFKKRCMTPKFISYMLGYSHIYVKAVLDGIDPISINVREGFNYLIDAVDSLKIKKN